MTQKITLCQTLEKPVHGYWDYGPKKYFEWDIEHHKTGKDAKGVFVRVGSWEANHWFHVAKGKTDKLTLSYAKQHLRAITNGPCAFEYKIR
jgi:hypothetical protein